MREPKSDRRLYAILAVLLSLGFAIAVFRCFNVPLHGGVDQNGYLVGGKNWSRTGTMKFAPRLPGTTDFDPHRFVGNMWVGTAYGTPEERYYLKYPLGLPVIYAACFWIGGDALGPALCHAVNPIAMAGAILGTFVLIRRFAGSWAALLGALLFAMSPTVVLLSFNPNSHATAVCVVTWGFVCLFHWQQSGSAWRGVLGGLLIGYATTIRYTEATLVVPLILICAMRWVGSRRSAVSGEETLAADRRPLTADLLPLLGWLIPVALLTAYNRLAIGTWTGYGPTNESSGFALEYAIENWETVIRQLGSTGLFGLFPLALVGLYWLAIRQTRVAIILAAWIVPCLLVYTFYYWAPDGNVTSYLRFFVTILPALALCVAWLARHVIDAMPTHARAATVAVAILFAVCLAPQAQAACQLAEADTLGRLILKDTADRVVQDVPEGSILVSGERPLLQHLQLVTDDLLYTGETFNRGYVQNLPNSAAPDEPQGLDPGRRDSIYARLKGADQPALDLMQDNLLLAAMGEGKRVFYIVPRRGNDPQARRLAARITRASPREEKRVTPEAVRRLVDSKKFEAEVVDQWTSPMWRPDVKPRGRRMDSQFNRRNDWQIVEIVKAPPPAPVKSK